MSESSSDIQSTMQEHRVFPPSAEFSAAAQIKTKAEYEALYRQSMEQPEVFWAEAASELEWFAPWTQVLAGEMGSA